MLRREEEGQLRESFLLCQQSLQLVEDVDFEYRLLCFIYRNASYVEDSCLPPLQISKPLAQLLGLSEEQTEEEVADAVEETERDRETHKLPRRAETDRERQIKRALDALDAHLSPSASLAPSPSLAASPSLLRLLQSGSPSPSTAALTKRLALLKKSCSSSPSPSLSPSPSVSPSLCLTLSPLDREIVSRILLPFQEQLALKYESLLELQVQQQVLDNAREPTIRSGGVPHIPSVNAPLESFLPNFLMKQLVYKAGIASVEDELLDKLRTSACDGFLKPLLQRLDIVLQQLPFPMFYNLQAAAPHCGLSAAKVIGISEVLHSLQLAFPNQRIYGFGNVVDTRHVLGSSILKLLRNIHPSLSVDAEALSALHDMATSCAADLVEVAMTFCSKLSATHDKTNYEKKSFGNIIEGKGNCNLWTLMSSASDNLTYDEMDSCQMAPLLLSRHVEAAVKSSMTRQLSYHAVSNGIKAVTLYSSSSQHNHLTIPPQLLYFALQHNPKTAHCCENITLEGLVFLTAVVEFLLSEVLELSGETCLSSSEDKLVLLSRHIMLSIKGDHELNSLFTGTIRGAGTLPTTAWSINCHGRSPTAPIFDKIPVHQLCCMLLRDYSLESRLFTAEASALLHALLEEFLMQEANKHKSS